jgi:nitrate reductase gamma subunit
MSLLDFARGPAIEIAFAIFLAGVLWRLLSLLLLPWATDRSVRRADAPYAVVGAVSGFVRHLWPPETYVRALLFSTLNGYVFHLGLAIIVFGLAQHIQFLRGLFGLAWPSLPTGVISVVSVITLASLLAALGRRMMNPVLKLLSTFNDYFSWFVTFLPVATGLIAVSHLWAPYETLLAMHILSVCLLLIWFPFGKLMHAFLVFLTRSETGIFYSRRGVEI